ncbi:MAG TPA: hypothetical protein VLF59_03915 [Candidatus Saccharimonadales bacterium]|nr:hypothetical protein [Candidatus Saccharimonadales bacterium]
MKIGRIVSLLTASVALLVAVCVPLASAATKAPSTGSTGKSGDSSSTAAGGGSVQGYASTGALQIGTIVQLQQAKDGAHTVAAASSKNPNQMFGVTVDPHELSLTLSSDNLANEVYVANSGTYTVLVSNQGGPIQVGDFVTISAINGVAMKASTDDATVFGRAVSAFSGKNGIGNVTLKNISGQTTQTVTLGTATVSINIERNPDKISTKEDLPKFLQDVGQAVARKPVSPIRIYLSIIITGLTIVVALVMLYSGIRHALIAIGRNPLSKKSIFRGLLEVILTGFLILIIGLFAVYLLLKL